MSLPENLSTMPPAFQELYSLFEERRENLLLYAQSGRAKQGYIDRENRLLQTLSEVLTELSSLRQLELWLAIEAKMKELQKRDPLVDGFVIHLDHCESPRHLAMIQGRLFS